MESMNFQTEPDNSNKHRANTEKQIPHPCRNFYPALQTRNTVRVTNKY